MFGKCSYFSSILNLKLQCTGIENQEIPGSNKISTMDNFSFKALVRKKLTKKREHVRNKT